MITISLKREIKLLLQASKIKMLFWLYNIFSKPFPQSHSAEQSWWKIQN